MTNVVDFLAKIAATSLEAPEQMFGLLGEGLQLMGAQLERFAELIDQLEQKLNATAE